MFEKEITNFITACLKEGEGEKVLLLKNCLVVNCKWDGPFMDIRVYDHRAHIKCAVVPTNSEGEVEFVDIQDVLDTVNSWYYTYVLNKVIEKANIYLPNCPTLQYDKWKRGYYYLDGKNKVFVDAFEYAEEMAKTKDFWFIKGNSII